MRKKWVGFGLFIFKLRVSDGKELYKVLVENIELRDTDLYFEDVYVYNEEIKVAAEEPIKRGISEGVDFKTMDFFNTEFEKESFDVIYACESICHAPDQRDFLKECFRILKPGGRLVVSGYFLTAKGKIKIILLSKNGWIHWP